MQSNGWNCSLLQKKPSPRLDKSCGRATNSGDPRLPDVTCGKPLRNGSKGLEPPRVLGDAPIISSKYFVKILKASSWIKSNFKRIYYLIFGRLLEQDTLALSPRLWFLSKELLIFLLPQIEALDDLFVHAERDGGDAARVGDLPVDPLLDGKGRHWKLAWLQGSDHLSLWVVRSISEKEMVHYLKFKTYCFSHFNVMLWVAQQAWRVL